MGHAGAEAFTAARIDDPAIARLRDKVELRPFAPEQPWPNDRPARVTWLFNSGERREAECLSARGGPDRPFSALEIMAKLAGIADPVYPALSPLAQSLIELDTDLLGEGWEGVVARMTGAGS